MNIRESDKSLILIAILHCQVIALVLLVSLIFAPCRADDTWSTHLNFLVASDHHAGTKEYNERHEGIGLTFINRKTHLSVTGMTYINSYNERSEALVFGQPIKCWPFVCFGWGMMGATGYKTANVIVAPYLSLTVGAKRSPKLYHKYVPGSVSAYGLTLPIEDWLDG